MPSEGKGREFESRQVRQKPPLRVVFFILGGRRTREVSSVAHSDTTALAGPEQREGRVVSPRAIETSAPKTTFEGGFFCTWWEKNSRSEFGGA